MLQHFVIETKGNSLSILLISYAPGSISPLKTVCDADDIFTHIYPQHRNVLRSLRKK